MKKICVPHLNFITRDSSLPEISSGLNTVEKHAIACSPWHGYSLYPAVTFSIAYAADAILLKYAVQEKNIRISWHADNAPVHEDSCVEFFIAFDDKGYYNLEFNCMGYCYFSYGSGRSGRKLINTGVIDRIRHMSAIQHINGDDFIQWELVLEIPNDVFIFHDLASLSGKWCRGNFFKCGDKLPEPHFLSWNAIASDKPDFHLPEFFGELQFR